MELGQFMPERPTRRQILECVRQREGAAASLIADINDHPFQVFRNRKRRRQALFELESAGRWLDRLPPPTRRERERAARGIGIFRVGG